MFLRKGYKEATKKADSRKNRLYMVLLTNNG